MLCAVKRSREGPEDSPMQHAEPTSCSPHRAMMLESLKKTSLKNNTVSSHARVAGVGTEEEGRRVSLDKRPLVRVESRPERRVAVHVGPQAAQHGQLQ